MQKALQVLTRERTKIGWGYGISVVLTSFVAGYLFAASVVANLGGDYAQRIVPSMMIMPIAVFVFGFWFLFSKNIAIFVSKVTAVSMFSVSALLFGAWL